MIAGSILTIVNNIQNLFKSSFQIKDLGPITNTGPDIAYAVSQVARFNANPGIKRWKAIVKIFRYCKEYSIWLSNFHQHHISLNY